MKTQTATKPCHLAEDLLSKFDNIQDGWVVLVGDGKIYKHLMNIKKQYNTALQNLLLFPGDWHILKNFQPILMKVYYAAGLREMAKNSGYHGSTLSLWSSVLILNEHTTYFLLQAWEALYSEMFHTYLNSSSHATAGDASCILLSSVQQKKPPQHAMKRICELVKDSHTDDAFRNFVEELCKTDKTWKFWA